MSEKSKIEQIVHKWRMLVKEGKKPNLKLLCSDYPELLDEVKKHISQLHTESNFPQCSSIKEQSKPAEINIEIDGYRNLRKISSGGQGIVFKALQESTGRHVALKVLCEGRQLSDEHRARFDREAQVLAALEHPNIISIIDRGQAANGLQYFAMNYIQGESLDKWVGEYRKSSLTENITSDPSKLLRLFMIIADAVNAAHLRGIIHRDLKPSNIIIDDQGNPHILDFGLARAGLPMRGQDGKAVITITGQFLGSLPWASPEQAEGLTSKIDTRTDVYALGVILYEMLTGEFPYEVVGNMRDVLDNIMRAEPTPPSSVIEARLAKQANKHKRWRKKHRNPITQDLEAIILKTLHKRPEGRYQNAGELARDIGNYLSGKTIEADSHRQSPRITRRHQIVAVVFFVMILGLVIGLVLRSLQRQGDKPTVPYESTENQGSVSTTYTNELESFIEDEDSSNKNTSDAARETTARIEPIFSEKTTSQVTKTEEPRQEIQPVIHDSNLRDVISVSIGLPKGSDPGLKELLALHELSAQNAGITDLTGLEYAINLTSLDLAGNKIVDLSPLAGLIKLERLNLWSNRINNVSALSGMTELRFLSVGDQVADISILSRFKKLEILKISGPLKDLTPLSDLKHLSSVEIDNALVHDISALSKLKNLTNLCLNFSPNLEDISGVSGLVDLERLWFDVGKIKDISSISNLKQLRELVLGHNRIEDISMLSGLTNIKILNLQDSPIGPYLTALSGISNIEELYLDHCDLKDISALRRLTKLKRLRLEGNQITDISNLAGLTALTHLNLGDNKISDITALSDMTEMQFLTIGDQIADISILSSFKKLESLKMAGPVKDLSPLSDLKLLSSLEIDNVLVSEISALSKLKNLTNLGLGNSKNLEDISGIPELINLERLWLTGGKIKDISPISNLKQLRVLVIDGNKIEDISPLSELTKMEFLNFGGNQISDLEPLKALTKLKSLTAYRNQIANVEPLESLIQLTHLNLYANTVDDASPLANLIYLEFLSLEANTTIKDVRPLFKLSNLREFNLTGSKVTDITVLKYMPNLTSLFLVHNGITDISALRDLTLLTRLKIGGNEISDITPLSNLKQLQHVGLNGNRIDNISALTNLTNLVHLDLRNNSLSAEARTDQIPRIMSKNLEIKVLFDAD
ncbi:leucine-rich repeat domain-containing protein [Planctomycetota bacterium]